MTNVADCLVHGRPPRLINIRSDAWRPHDLARLSISHYTSETLAYVKLFWLVCTLEISLSFCNNYTFKCSVVILFSSYCTSCLILAMCPLYVCTYVAMRHHFSFSLMIKTLIKIHLAHYIYI